MQQVHKLKNIELDLTNEIARHSADVCHIYKHAEAEPIYLGYYLPADFNKSKKYPTFVFIHGGGWASHKIFEDQPHWQGDHLGFLARYFANRGFVCVSIDYRLAVDKGQTPGHELMDCYEDCCDAMDFILANAEEYGIDPQRMYLLGESAGGHLAGAVATFHYDRRYTFQKVFLVNAITDMLDPGWFPRVPVHSQHSALESLSIEERARFLSPLYQLDGQIGDVVLIHGTADACVKPAHSEKFYERMLELSQKCDLHWIEDTNHAFLLAEYVSDLRACKMGIQIIEQYLR